MGVRKSSKLMVSGGCSGGISNAVALMHLKPENSTLFPVDAVSKTFFTAIQRDPTRLAMKSHAFFPIQCGLPQAS